MNEKVVTRSKGQGGRGKIRKGYGRKMNVEAEGISERAKQGREVRVAG